MEESTSASQRMKVVLVVLLFSLLSIFIIGLIYLSTVDAAASQIGSASYGTWILIAYAAGLSMIILPCTLPLVFIIVPLSMGKGYKKGLSMAALFGLGLIVTITAYGVAIALLGQFAGIDKATRIMWLFAGVIAYMFGLAELKLLKLKLPSYSKTPKFIQERGDYFKSFLMGLLLGNAGVGCPNPFFYVMLAYIASAGTIAVGASLGFIHGIGRAVPLIMVSILAILGVNVSKKLVEKRETVERWTGWGLLFIGAFIFLNGIFGHSWWEDSPIHYWWNILLDKAGFISELDPGALIIDYVAVAMLVLWVLIPIVWFAMKKRSAASKRKSLAVVGVISILIVLVGGYFAHSEEPVAEQTGEVKEFDVTAFQWGFEPQFIEVELGDRVILNVESRDVTHGLKINEFSVDETITPGETTVINFVADEAGSFDYECSIACGAGHSDQKGFLTVTDPNTPKKENGDSPLSIESTLTDTAIVVDGIVDDTWSSAQEYTLTTKYIEAGQDVMVRSLNDGESIYFLAQWQDDTKNDTEDTDPDRIALSFDITEDADIAMGAAGVPHVKEEQETIGEGTVDIWHWKAFDDDAGAVNGIDDEFAGPFEALKEHYYRDDDDAYGGTDDVSAIGVYDQSSSMWTVELSRSLVTGDTAVGEFGPIDKQLGVTTQSNVAFAIWDGESETAGEHKATDWYTLQVK